MNRLLAWLSSWAATLRCKEFGVADTRPHYVTETGAACPAPPIHPWMTDEERARSAADDELETTASEIRQMYFAFTGQPHGPWNSTFPEARAIWRRMVKHVLKQRATSSLTREDLDRIMP